MSLSNRVGYLRRKRGEHFERYAANLGIETPEAVDVVKRERAFMDIIDAEIEAATRAPVLEQRSARAR
jgi:hypothetical protein